MAGELKQMTGISMLLPDNKTVFLSCRSLFEDESVVCAELKDELHPYGVRRETAIHRRGSIIPVSGGASNRTEWLYRVGMSDVTEIELAKIRLIMGERITSVLHAYSDGFFSIHDALVAGRSELDLYDPRQNFLGTVYRDRETKELMFRSGGTTEPLAETKWETLHDEVIDGGVAR